VLEHVKEPEKIARRMFDILPVGGHMFHSIDFRDHRDFGQPFAFLEMTDEEYASIGTENRLRPSDWLAHIENAGFQVINRSHEVLQADGTTKFYHDGKAFRPTMTEATRERFAEPFRSKDLADLSVVCMQVVCRKP
jgi:hypothetical protein